MVVVIVHWMLPLWPLSGALTAASTRNDVLDIIRDLEIADRAVTGNSIGKASSA